MVLIYTYDDECIEVPEAETVALEDALVVCRDGDGRVVRSLPAEDVRTFTANEAVAEVLRDEVCDDEAPETPVAT